jgi:hypothetical protein
MHPLDAMTRGPSQSSDVPGDGAARTPERERVARVFTRIEDAFYIGLGILLSVAGAVLLGQAAVVFARALWEGAFGAAVVSLLDQLLLVLMIVEILYTVQVSFREHVVVPEPFVLVALIAGVRRILVITAEFSTLAQKGEAAFRQAMIELGLLAAMTGILVGCLAVLRKRAPTAVAERA